MIVFRFYLLHDAGKSPKTEKSNTWNSSKSRHLGGHDACTTSRWGTAVIKYLCRVFVSWAPETSSRDWLVLPASSCGLIWKQGCFIYSHNTTVDFYQHNHRPYPSSEKSAITSCQHLTGGLKYILIQQGGLHLNSMKCDDWISLTSKVIMPCCHLSQFNNALLSLPGLYNEREGEILSHTEVGRVGEREREYRESRSMSQERSLEATEEKKRQRGREGGRRRREGVKSESWWRLPLWPDVKLSRQLQLSSKVLLPDFNLLFTTAALDIWGENVRTTQAEVQPLCQRRESCRRGFD